MTGFDESDPDGLRGPWEAEVDPDEPGEIAVSRADGRYAYGFGRLEARRIRDALNALPDDAFGERP